jgi:16S rRNA (guanine527-N7)-methyltransferase
VGEREDLTAQLVAAGIAPDLALRLGEYGSLLLEANRRVNLTGASTAQDLAPHILDSLTLCAYVTSPLVDIGSGGGLPAIPVALSTGAAITLVESTVKKAAFLESAVAALQLDARVVAERAESAARDAGLRAQFASATARAVSSAPTVLELAAPFLRLGGRALLQRGRMDTREREAVLDAAPMLGMNLREERLLDGERRILIFEKTGETPQRFPRRPGVPEKRPLCLRGESQ